MGLRTAFVRLRDRLVYEQVYRTPVPQLSDSPVVRMRLTFRGRVQGVGFRYTTELWAQRLGLTGFCVNLPNGDVLAELQGAAPRIDFYLQQMHRLRRVKIRHQTAEQRPLHRDEACFRRGDED